MMRAGLLVARFVVAATLAMGGAIAAAVALCIGQGHKALPIFLVCCAAAALIKPDDDVFNDPPNG